MGGYDLDDLFIPRDADHEEECSDATSHMYGRHYLLPLGGVLSMLSYVYLLWMYFWLQSPIFKRHPTTLAIYKCVFEAMFVQEYVWIPFMDESSFFLHYTSSAPYDCRANGLAAIMAFISQFAMTAHELCFFIISLDLRNAYTNPFSSYKQNRIQYSTIVGGVAFATACGLMALGPHVYGLSTLGIIWIQSKRENQSPNMSKFTLYYFLLFCIYSYCLWAMYQFSKHTERGFSKTVSNRKRIMLRAQKFTTWFVIYGCIIMVFESVSFFSNGETTQVLIIPAALNSLRGVFSLIVILYCNWSEVTKENMNPFRLSLDNNKKNKTVDKVAEERVLLQPHLNTALRAEILYFTTQGIMYATREYQKQMRINGAADRAPSVEEDTADDFIGSDDFDPDNPLYAFSATGRVIKAPPKQDTFQNRISKRISATFLRGQGSSGAPSPSVPSGGGSRSSHSVTGVSLAPMKSSTTSSGGSFKDDVRNRADSSSTQSSESGGNILESELERLTMEQESAVSQLRYDAVDSELLELSGGSQRVHLPVPPAHIDPVSLQRLSFEYSQQRRRSMEHRSSQDGTSNGSTSMNPILTAAAAANSNSNRPESGTAQFALGNSADLEKGGLGSGKHQESNQWRKVADPAAGQFSNSRDLDVNSSSGAAAAGRPRSSTLSSPQGKFSRSMKNAINTAKSALSSDSNEFRFKDYCPRLFETVRQMCGINAEEYAKSFESTCKEKFSEGRSGAFMFYSSDERCIAKTCNREELFALHRIMPEYSKYIADNPDSLLVRFLGAHSITMYGVNLYFVVMLNVFPTFPLSERYDLKGSWVNRHGSAGSKRDRNRIERVKTGASSTSSPLFQDNDMQSRVALKPEVAVALVAQINKDVDLLKRMRLMDYSLLIGVKRERFQVLANKNPSNNTSPLNKNKPLREYTADDIFQRDADGGLSARMVEGPGTYYIGIIDVLQEWNWMKKMERFAKVYLKMLDGDGISAVEPDYYADRFWTRCILDTFDMDNDVEEEAHHGGSSSSSNTTDGSKSPKHAHGRLERTVSSIHIS